METNSEKPAKLLLHACCGPCSMEPVRLLRQRGIEPHLYYANSNIAPAEEYAHRRDTIAAWAADEALAFTEGPYRPETWQRQVAHRAGQDARTAALPSAADQPYQPSPPVPAPTDERSAAPQRPASARTADAAASSAEEARAQRCRACYRMRFEEAAAYAREQGFDALGTTLSVSPYQYTGIIREELERACERAGIRCFFEDYSPHYAEATRRSKEVGLYRQDYCGCLPSKAEADAQRAERKAARAAQKAERARARQAEEAQLQARRQERAAYDAKQARKRAILKALRSK